MRYILYEIRFRYLSTSHVLHILPDVCSSNFMPQYSVNPSLPVLFFSWYLLSSSLFRHEAQSSMFSFKIFVVSLPVSRMFCQSISIREISNLKLRGN